MDSLLYAINGGFTAFFMLFRIIGNAYSLLGPFLYFFDLIFHKRDWKRQSLIRDRVYSQLMNWSPSKVASSDNITQQRLGTH